MVFAAQFGIVGLSGYAIKSSLSDTSESTNSLASSLTFSGGGDEEDFPIYVAGIGSSSNWTLLSMNEF